MAPGSTNHHRDHTHRHPGPGPGAQYIQLSLACSCGRDQFEVLGEAAIELDNLTLTTGGAPPQQDQPPASTPPPPQTAQLPAGELGVWVRTGGPPGGLGYDIRMQPDNPDIMYVTDANAGVHKSTDGDTPGSRPTWASLRRISQALCRFSH